MTDDYRKDPEAIASLDERQYAVTQESGGLRYCIDSAALRFVPYEHLEAEGYGQYKKLLEMSENKEEVVR
jgi:hypothetical protein